MSQFNFFLPSAQWLPEHHRPCLLATDVMESPIPSQIKWESDRLTVSLLEQDACRVHALVATPSGAAVLLPTVWLFPQWRPYRLELELLRGLVSRLRRGMELWLSSGLPVPESFPTDLQQLTKSFLLAWRTQHQPDASERLWPLLERGYQLLHQLPHTLAEAQGADLFQPIVSATPPSPGPPSAAANAGKFSLGLRLEPQDLLGTSLDSPSHWPPAAAASASTAATPSADPTTGPEDAATATAATATDADADAPQRLGTLLQSAQLTWVQIGQDWKTLLTPANAAANAAGNSPANAAAHPAGHSANAIDDVALALQRLRGAGRQIIWGPLLAIQDNCLPTGMKIGPDGQLLNEAFAAHLRQHLPGVTPYCDLLHVVSGINGVGVAGLTPTIQYNLVRSALEVVASLSPQTPTMISFAQPLGERLGWSVGGQHPDQFLAKLAKERAPIKAIGLELDLGYFPTGTLPRDPLHGPG